MELKEYEKEIIVDYYIDNSIRGLEWKTQCGDGSTVYYLLKQDELMIRLTAQYDYTSQKYIWICLAIDMGVGHVNIVKICESVYDDSNTELSKKLNKLIHIVEKSINKIDRPQLKPDTYKWLKERFKF